MIDGLKPYPKMKDPGVPWLGPVPEHWRMLPGRACFVEIKIPNTGLIETTVLSLSYGQIVVKSADRLHGLVPESFETYQIVEPGDIIIRPTDLQNDWSSLRFALSKHRGIITSAYMCFQPQQVLTREYAHLLLHTYDLKKVFYGLGSGLRQNLDWRDFKYLQCVVPPLSEQAAIVRFLDHVDRRIRRYIRAKQKLIKLLEEQKQAIIHRAVTRGLDPNVRLKHSGVEWLGDVPEHWSVVPLKRVGTVRIGLIYSPGDVSDNKGVLVLRASNVLNGQIVHADDVYVSKKIPSNLFVREDDILVCVRSGSRSLVGKSALISAEFDGVSYGAFMSLLRTIDNKFYFRVLNSNLLPTVMAQFETSTINQLTQNDLRNLMVPVPPINERKAITDFLSVETGGIEAAISVAVKEVDLLRECRIRLIADVVTGKIDVREIEARLLEESEEPDALGEAADEVEGEEAPISGAEVAPEEAGA